MSTPERLTPLPTGQRFRCAECGAEQVPDDCGHRTLTGKRRLLIEDDYLAALARTEDEE